MSISVHFDLIPATQVELELAQVATNFVNLEDPFQKAFRAQERAQEEPFRSGQLTDTGNLRASLTQPTANGAIREAHSLDAEFGTSVRYARPAAARSGTHVLVEPVDDLAELFLDHILEPVRL
jgi:hypothetical protein